ncbi:MAG: DNA translocase FtsK [Ruminococcaceae bacterium]|nr:DNA translocase FtsK [Oscillospiraceae bacterium]
MATGRKPASKKPAAKRTPQKQATKKATPRKNTKNGKMYIEREKIAAQSRQVLAIVLFAISILLPCITLIPGGNLWALLQNFFFGLFGICAFLWPFVLMYVAIILSIDKPMAKSEFVLVVAAILISFIAGATFIFNSNFEIANFSEYWEKIKEAYTIGRDTRNGGAFGAIFGGAILWMFGSKVPAAITVCLCIFVFLMILTGTTLASLLEGLWKPVEKGTKVAEEQFINTKRAFEEIRQRKFNPDVELGPGFGDESTEEILDDTISDSEKEVDLRPSEPVPPSVMLDDIIKKATAAKEPPKEEEKVDKRPTLSENGDGNEYVLPTLNLLSRPKRTDKSAEAELKSNSEKLIDILGSFGVEATMVGISRGPSVTRYELAPAAGVRINKITNLADDIALSLAATSVRIEAPIPGKAAIGIEVPNNSRDIVNMREVLDSDTYREGVKKDKLTVALGKDIAGHVCTMNITKMPHLLVAGTTGSGKSIAIKAMILSILYNAKPDEVKLVMIDPKQVELKIFSDLPHLLVPVVTDPRKAAGALSWAVKEMLNRYKMFSETNVRDIEGYNELAKMDDEKPFMPQIVIFVDEFADLMMVASNEVEDSVCRLAQMARAAGMHLVVATQSPRADVITGLIKANIPSRLSLKVANGMESRIILDMQGAERLLGNGDMLFNPVGVSKPIRIQGCFVSTEEVGKVIDHIKLQGKPSFSEEIMDEIDKLAANASTGKKSTDGIITEAGGEDSDPLITQAIEVILTAGQASTTLIQRKLRVGYARAARIIDELEERGIVGPFEGAKPRKVLITKAQWFEMNALAESATENKQLSFEDEVSILDGEE